ncbi:hypothetical protein BDM02DRAFT_3125384 [Thelephora ganbajun]|uniref:Uncharacterized protein n=1 Tax=Thelephora ganbajun TaxID=370292 RepID=A0ACB6ZVW0_THEGA|nr:hypothetical protein BDM02DRAFT_3125384 [Thelephora ganbajun]
MQFLLASKGLSHSRAGRSMLLQRTLETLRRNASQSPRNAGSDPESSSWSVKDCIFVAIAWSISLASAHEEGGLWEAARGRFHPLIEGIPVAPLHCQVSVPGGPPKEGRYLPQCGRSTVGFGENNQYFREIVILSCFLTGGYTKSIWHTFGPSSSCQSTRYAESRDAERKSQKIEVRMHNLLIEGITERRRAVEILIAKRECLQQKEIEVEGEGEPFCEKLTRLKVETLKVLGRQKKILNGLDAGEPIEIFTGHELRKPR